MKISKLSAALLVFADSSVVSAFPRPTFRRLHHYYPVVMTDANNKKTAIGPRRLHDKKENDVTFQEIEIIQANKSNSTTAVFSSARQFIDNFLAAGGGSDEIGARGEAYFFAQAILIIFIFAGGIPLFSDYLKTITGAALFLTGILVLGLTALDMGDSITPWPKPNGNGLVRDGLYGQVRHPMYAGLLAAVSGFSIWTGSFNRLMLTVLLYVVIELKSEYEESELAKSYPGEYEEYQEEVTSKFLPKYLVELWRKKRKNDS